MKKSVSSEVIYDDKGCDWHCDNCRVYMNSQPGFTTVSDKWTCAECGYENDVSENNIVEMIYNEYGHGSYKYEDNEYEDDEENISVYDAALIWISNGKDEDYMFGYSETELENAL